MRAPNSTSTVLLVHAAGPAADAIASGVEQAGYHLLGPCGDARAAIAVCAELLPDVALVQQSLGGPLPTDRLALQLQRLGPVPTIFLVDDESPEALSRLTATRPLALVPPATSPVALQAIIATAVQQAGSLQAARDPDERFFAVAIDMLCFLDFSGYFRRLSPAWERTLGWTIAELMSQPFIEFVHPDDRERTLAQNRDVRGGGHALGFENRYRCKDGSYRWLHWNAASDTAHGVIYSVARDITATKQAEAERERLIADLTKALAEVKSLQEILPICSYCKKIRDDDDYWQHVESYIAEHTGAKFSHGVCPSCFDQVMETEFPETR